MIEMELISGVILIGASLMLALLGLGAAAIMPGIDRWSRRFFMIYFLCLALYAAFCLAEGFSYLRPEMKPMQKGIVYMETLFSSFLVLLMPAYLLHCCGEDWRNSALLASVGTLWILFFIMMNMSLFTDWLYSFGPGNKFLRGDLYSLVIMQLEAMLLFNLAGVVRRRHKLSKRAFGAFLAGLLPMTLALFIHLFVSVYDLLTVGVVMSALSMFVLILSDQIGQDLRMQREIAHQRTSIMVLQMRPHFIYNTMTTIYYLCKQDPDLAQQVTLDFTTYLRRNFKAIASEKPIAFAEELEHTRAYLAVEQAQYGDGLQVEYDTAHTDFRVPPLTLQPIVENAVKHGMDPDAGPLRILIRTARMEAGSEITVENNGADFEPVDDGEPHIALKNLRHRLELMCQGKLKISPREGGGTVVRVTIP